MRTQDWGEQRVPAKRDQERGAYSWLHTWVARACLIELLEQELWLRSLFQTNVLGPESGYSKLRGRRCVQHPQILQQFRQDIFILLDLLPVHKEPGELSYPRSDGGTYWWGTQVRLISLSSLEHQFKERIQKIEEDFLQMPAQDQWYRAFDTFLCLWKLRRFFREGKIENSTSSKDSAADWKGGALRIRANPLLWLFDWSPMDAFPSSSITCS